MFINCISLLNIFSFTLPKLSLFGWASVYETACVSIFKGSKSSESERKMVRRKERKKERRKASRQGTMAEIK